MTNPARAVDNGDTRATPASRAVDGSGYSRPDPPTSPNVLRTPRAGTLRGREVDVLQPAPRAATRSCRNKRTLASQRWPPSRQELQALPGALISVTRGRTGSGFRTT